MLKTVRIRAFVPVLIALCMLLCVAVPAFASGVEDPAAAGNITVSLTSADGKALAGGSLRAYQVASLEDGYTFAFTPAFSGCEIDLSKHEFTEADCDTVIAFVEENHTPASKTAAVSEEGTAAFASLPLGMYLIAQDVAAEGYNPILPFLAVVPEMIDGVANYDVKCAPKSVEKTPDLSVPLTVEKKVISVNGNTPPSDTPFSFVLVPAEKGQPMPKNAQYNLSPDGSLTVSRNGGGTVDFGSIAFTAADAGKTYVYSLREVKGAALYYTYDTSVYQISLRVYKDEKGALQCEFSAQDEGGKAYDDIVFNNTYNNDNPDIPRTGQLWWPVFALAGAGAVLTLAGLWRRRRGEALR